MWQVELDLRSRGAALSPAGGGRTMAEHAIAADLEIQVLLYWYKSTNTDTKVRKLTCHTCGSRATGGKIEKARFRGGAAGEYTPPRACGAAGTRAAGGGAFLCCGAVATKVI